MVDEQLILRKLSDLQEYLDQIREFGGMTVRQYGTDWKTQRIIERTLQMMIECCIDIAGHIISEKGLRTPATYAESFAVLYETGIINGRLLGSLEKMARCRNLIVHRYDRIDAEIIVGILKKNLGDFTRFKDAVLAFLEADR
jgi:uncharacterized protein YutE (UPF0331/DUF86 family)